MHTRIPILLAATVGFALTCSVASAQLQLSGHTSGSFVDLSEPNTTVSNAPDGSWATFTTGIPVSGSTQSKITFANAAFTDIGANEPIQAGLFEITNGRTQVGSGASAAKFNLGLQLTSPTMQSVALSTITFQIDNTPNGTGSVPDTFSVAYNQPAPLHIGNYLVQFHVNVDPKEFQINEDTTLQKGDVTVTFTPVPEPATYAAIGAGLLVGLVLLRRFKADKSFGPLPDALA